MENNTNNNQNPQQGANNQKDDVITVSAPPKLEAPEEMNDQPIEPANPVDDSKPEPKEDVSSEDAAPTIVPVQTDDVANQPVEGQPAETETPSPAQDNTISPTIPSDTEKNTPVEEKDIKGDQALAAQKKSFDINKGSFQLKPEVKEDPQIGVELEKDEPITNQVNQTSAPAPKPDPLFNTSMPQGSDFLAKDDPIAKKEEPKAVQSGSGKPVAVAGLLVAAFIALGFFGGYFGFKYSPKIASLIKTSADETNQSTTASNEITWKDYANSKYGYSLKYPSNWTTEGINSAASKSIALSYASEKTGDDFKIEILTSSLSGKTLEKWIEQNSTKKSEGLSKKQIDSQPAYEQVIEKNKQVNNYIEFKDKVLTVSFVAKNNFEAGQTYYNKLLNSIEIQ